MTRQLWRQRFCADKWSMPVARAATAPAAGSQHGRTKKAKIAAAAKPKPAKGAPCACLRSHCVFPPRLDEWSMAFARAASAATAAAPPSRKETTKTQAAGASKTTKGAQRACVGLAMCFPPCLTSGARSAACRCQRAAVAHEGRCRKAGEEVACVS